MGITIHVKVIEQLTNSETAYRYRTIQRNNKDFI